MSVFRDKPSTGADVFSDEMVTDDTEAAAKQPDDTIGELGLILLQNNVLISLSCTLILANVLSAT